ncbi:hypothetical protein BGC33_05595 [Bathymodiolus thermophilus thioautotrophic gill symbiont]|uniref:RHS repeat-associated core domain-containing protein n=2 Tax=Bathymodiolus thermophilus thioautotrophic gill symbiont TaxID=2360 RepID=A0A1J5UGY3_9GAMM|nr:hypothetical protein BGC33_05595 [Bathymodiolus thermophilus thioautotrophic gill symbiont]
MGFIHMNGRVYDPSIGRFLSADPNIQAPYNTQSYNRYSYTINNPLKYTDPDGYFFTAFIAAAITKAIVVSSMHILTQMAIAYAVSYVVTYVVTDSSKAAQEAGLAAGLFMGIGGIRGGKIGANGKMQYNPGWESGSMKTLAAHGLAGGIVQDRMGGSFGAGFLAGSLGSYLGSSGNARNASELIGNTAREAIVGGTISVVGGGKFANGAQTGAFRYLFNESMHTAHTTTGKRKYSSVEELQKALGSDGTTFGKRPLKGSGGVMGVGPISDYYNSEFAHEQMFFTKGGELRNLGYFDDGVIHSDGDRQNDTLIQSYTFDPIIYHGLDSSNPAGFGINDYSLPFNNCQHYCDSIRKRF